MEKKIKRKIENRRKLHQNQKMEKSKDLKFAKKTCI